MGQRRRAEVGLPAHRLVGLDAPSAVRRPDGEAVVLGGDLDLAGAQVLDRVVGAAVAEGELVGLQADGLAEQLVAEADAPHRPRADELAHGGDDVAQRGGVAGAVGQEDRVGVGGRQLGGRHRARVQLDARAALDEVAHDRALDPGVDDRDPRAVAVAGSVMAGRRDLAREVEADHRRLGGDPLARLRLAHGGREDAAAHRARAADVAHERARVDAGDRRDAAVAQPVQPAALGVGGVLAVDRRAHDRRARPWAVGLHRLLRDAVVADVRVGEGDELAGEGRVGHRLLVAAHAGREDDLAGDHRLVRVRAARVAVEAGAVLEQDVGAGELMPAVTAKARSR